MLYLLDEPQAVSLQTKNDFVKLLFQAWLLYHVFQICQCFLTDNFKLFSFIFTQLIMSILQIFLSTLSTSHTALFPFLPGSYYHFFQNYHFSYIHQVQPGKVCARC